MRRDEPVARVDSTDRCNIFKMEVFAMAVGRREEAVRAIRGSTRSPGRPSAARREERVQFWEAIARGASSADAAREAGVSQPVGTRWFRQFGGMPPIPLAPVSGRYLSFAEREEIAAVLVPVRGSFTNRTREATCLRGPEGFPVCLAILHRAGASWRPPTRAVRPERAPPAWPRPRCGPETSRAGPGSSRRRLSGNPR